MLVVLNYKKEAIARRWLSWERVKKQEMKVAKRVLECAGECEKQLGKFVSGK